MRFAICINNSGYSYDLNVKAVYQVLPDESAAKSNYLRIIDETGEDYLYPASCFVPIAIPIEAEQIFSPCRQTLMQVESDMGLSARIACHLHGLCVIYTD